MASPSISASGQPASDALPSAEELFKAASLSVQDREGRALPFDSLYNGANTKKRVLIIFVRRFFCGNRRTYPQMVSKEIQPEMLEAIDTSIAVIGYGSPSLIDEYAQMSGCPYPIYADPSGGLFDALGLMKTWNSGPSSEHEVQNLLMAFFNGFWPVPHEANSEAPPDMAQQQRQQEEQAARKSDPTQLSGEFLFEPLPGSSGGGGGGGQDKYVTWCYRMKMSEGHTSIPGIKQVLGV